MNGVKIARTPILIPSFSSKGFPEVSKLLKMAEELVEDEILVSAYDIHYEKIKPPFDFPTLIFLDSGGYEASKDTELSDLGERDHTPKPWTQAMHNEVLSTWATRMPTVVISYDHPKERISIRKQINRANRMPLPHGQVLREILIKPETSTQSQIKIESALRNVKALGEFDVIGVTEKEIGNSVLSRMENIARLRLALNRIGKHTPIHIFGSLDTITTPMYFIAGADIFDGLTWLRFAFHEGSTMYRHNYGALHLGLDTKAHIVDGRCWHNNYFYMKNLKLQMHRFLNSDDDFNCFEWHADDLRKAYQTLLEHLGI